MSSFSSTRRKPYTAVHACIVQQLFPGAFVGIHPQIVPDKVRNIFHFTETGVRTSQRLLTFPPEHATFFLVLNRDLGTGKTCFARGFVRARVGDPDLPVTSPSYLLDNTYEVHNEGVT